MAVAYRGLRAHKNVAEVCLDAMKLTDDAQQLASLHKLRGIIIDGEGIVRARQSGYNATQTPSWTEINRILKPKGTW